VKSRLQGAQVLVQRAAEAGQTGVVGGGKAVAQKHGVGPAAAKKTLELSPARTFTM
jgi:hypothetical protein